MSCTCRSPYRWARVLAMFTVAAVATACGNGGHGTSVSAACDAAMRRASALAPDASDEQMAQVQDATLTACRSSAEWIAGASRHIKGIVAAGVSPESVLAAYCPDAPTAPACRGVTPATEPSARPTTPTTNPSTISLAEFLAIEVGMTHGQVEAIVGSYGTLNSEGPTGYTIYSWLATHGPPGANATVSFDAGIVQNKSQIGLE